MVSRSPSGGSRGKKSPSSVPVGLPFARWPPSYSTRECLWTSSLNYLERVITDMPSAFDDVRYLMNNFVICVGTYVAPIAETALTTARTLGQVEIDLGQTACKVPAAEPYILKSRRGAPVAPKRQTFRC